MILNDKLFLKLKFIEFGLIQIFLHLKIMFLKVSKT